MPEQTAPRRGGWSGAASWDDLPDAAPPPPALATPDAQAGPRAAEVAPRTARHDAGGWQSAQAWAQAPDGVEGEPHEGTPAADGSAEDRLARARAALAQAEGHAGDAGAGVPDFLPMGSDARPASWADLRDGTSTDGARATSDGGADALGRSRRPADRPARRHRAEDPPRSGAAAHDAEPDQEDIARQIVLRQLAMAPRSRAQLETKLRQRNCPDDVAGRVLDRMTEVGLVDDEAYAGMLVRSQQATKGLARRALAHELRKKGIDKDLADAALEEVDPEEERRTARALVDKKLRSMGGLGVDVQTRRLAGMLARKGYSSGLAYAVIRDAIADAPEHQRD